MRLFIAHQDGAYLTGIDASDWSSLSGVPSLSFVGRALEPVLSRSALVTGSQTSPAPRLQIFDIHDYSVLATHDMSSTVGALRAAPDESFVAVGHVGGNRLSFLNTDDWTLTSPEGLVPNTVNSVDVHPNNDWVAAAHDSSPYFTVVSKASETIVFAPQVLTSNGNGVSFSPDGGLVAVAVNSNDDNNVVIFDTVTWEMVQTLSLGNTAQAVRFSPDGAYLACGRSFGVGYEVFRTSDWGEEDIEDGAPSTVRGLRFGPTGALLAIAHNSSPYYSVRNVGTWDNAITADFPAVVPGNGRDVCWVPDFFGSQATTTPAATFDADSGFSEADNVAEHATAAPLPEYSSEAAVSELHEADYAAHATVPEFDAQAQLELRATYDAVAPVQEPGFTAITGLEIEQVLPLETVLGPIVLGIGFDSSFDLDSTATISAATSFLSRMAMSGSMDSNLAGNMTFAEVASLADAASISHVLTMFDALGMGSTEDTNHTKALIFLSQMAMESQLPLPNTSTAINLAAAMTLHSLAVYGVQLDEVSTLEMTSAFEVRYNAVVEAMSTMAAATSMDQNLRAQAVFFSTMEQGGTFDTEAVLQMEFESLLGGFTLLQIGDDIFEGWVLNISEDARGNKATAFTNYDHYPFSSIVTFKGRPYGVADDGLYLLEGDTDEGQAIEASFKTGLLDLGRRQVKDAKALYLGYTSDGRIVLKVTTTRDGKKREDWYRLMQKEATDMRTGRITIQRGLRSTYWQFELCNVDGADFDIDDATLVYQLMTRRIRNA